MNIIILVVPEVARLEGYRAALQRGFSPDNLRDISSEELIKLDADAEDHLRLMNDTGEGRTITLPNGNKVPRLPMVTRWIWDRDFAGVIKFRYVPGSNDLPPHVLGHVGYSVVGWKQGQGYATQALRMMMPLVRELGVTELKLTCKPDNIPSQKVITANGGKLVREIIVPEYGNAPGYLFVLAC